MMIRLSMSACRPAELQETEFDSYVRERHVAFAKLLEGLRLLSVTRVERFHGPGVDAEPSWFVDAWWEDGEALTRCFRSPGGLALLGDRMTMMDDPLPVVADATEQVRHGTSAGGMFDPSVGPRVSSGSMKLHVLVPEHRSGEVEVLVDSLEPESSMGDSSGLGAYSVSRGTGASYPLNNVITGVEPPVIPRVPSRGTALELWFSSHADMDSAAAASAPLRALLDAPEAVWWYGESREVMMSLPVASFLALDPEESDR
jgi:hypothetical protein